MGGPLPHLRCCNCCSPDSYSYISNVDVRECAGDSSAIYSICPLPTIYAVGDGGGGSVVLRRLRFVGK